MKKIHLWLLVVMSIFITTLTANAEVHYGIVIGDLSYDLDDDYHTAAVSTLESTAIETVIIPSNVSYKGQSYAVTFLDCAAFAECKSLKSVTIPNGVKRIGDGCFQDCENLSSVSLPEGLNKLENEVFRDCINLSSITFPEDLTEIGFACFWCCYNLSSVYLPEGLKIIRDDAFRNCKGLTSITIPQNVTEIEGFCFGDCSNLTSVSLPEGLNEIGSGAFYNCYKLNRVIANNPVPAIITDSSFPLDIDSKTEFLYVPKGSVEAYESSDWKYYFEKILEIDSAEVEEIGACPTGINYSEPYEVFTFAGAKVHTDFDSLSPGIYIIHQGNLTEKLSVHN
ncbi:MAG: leucine-rich repeat domain-containing protein [Bacteroidales bacterium]|nr:leucine-rich repeat domain-containing protein [Bacteroidales bacterium]